MRPLHGLKSRRDETRARPIALQPIGQNQLSAGPAACADRQFPIRHTRLQPAESARTAVTRRSIGFLRIVERPLVQLPRRADQFSAADLRQDPIEPCCIALLVLDRAAGNAVAVTLAIDLKA